MTRLSALAGSTLLAVIAESRPSPRHVTQGTLLITDRTVGIQAECPLKHTDVKADISGFVARVTVTQEFENRAADRIEALYVFPLPPNAAVDDMTLAVGKRTIRGLIQRRDEARAMYEEARQKGKLAGLLDQERPNIFTQSVANIMPGEKVRVTISYVERLRHEDSSYEFVFPMVAGPRYIPADPSSVPDSDRIAPPVTPPHTRAGHDIALRVTLDAGLPIDLVNVPTHDVVVQRPPAAAGQAVVTLRDKGTLPNRDFILRYQVAGRRIQDALLTHRGTKGGYFTLILQPPERVMPEEITPKELVFVMDTSGSMMGFPIEKAKEAMSHALEGLHARDTFNLITFAGDTHVLFPAPVPATAENREKARQFLASRAGRGGTEMMKAIRAALDGSGAEGRIRVVCFMTDAYVGNESEILTEIQRHPHARIFAFGIGSSVNRYLLDKMAELGRGEVEYVGLKDDGSAAARRFHERVRTPLLTDISVDWNGLPVSDVLPSRIPDLFSAKALAITGRYSGPARGVIRVRAKAGGKPFVREIAADLPASELRHGTLATLWARAKVDYLMHVPMSPYRADGEPSSGDWREQVTKLGLEYRLMTPFTSFVAVEETLVSEKGSPPRRVHVPVEIPDGVSYEGVFGAGDQLQEVTTNAVLLRSARTPMFASPVRDRERESADKLDPALRSRTGKIAVKVWLVRTNSAVLDELKKLGFEFLMPPGTGRSVTGRIAADRLRDLVRLAAVTYVEPMN